MTPIIKGSKTTFKYITKVFIILFLLASCVHKPPPLDRVIVVPHLNTDKPGMVVK